MLSRNQYLIKEREGTLKSSNTFDIYDAETEEQLFECIPDNKMMPQQFKVIPHDGSLPITIANDSALFKTVISVYDGNNKVLAHFRKKGFSLGAEYKLNSADNKEMGTLKGEWDQKKFTLNLNGTQIAHIYNKILGTKQEIKNTVNHYLLTLDFTESEQNTLYAIAAVFCIDMTLKAY
jgi:hypothetical protein